MNNFQARFRESIANFRAGFREDIADFRATISEESTFFRAEIDADYRGDIIPAYDGSYDVTPLAYTEQVLETSGKSMAGDVSVREIPYFETTNEAGGYTVNIG